MNRTQQHDPREGAATLVAELEAAIAQRSAKREGREVRFLCPLHEDDGQPHDPSARWNPGKRTWFCDVCKKGGGVRDLAKRLGITEGDAGDPSWTPRGPAVAVYPYTDERGKLLFEVCRTAAKQFPCRRPDSSKMGGCAWNLRGVRRVLYRLPKVLAAVNAGVTIHVVEGEKDVEAIEKAGGVATCNPGGAGKWRKEHAEALRGAGDVIVVADRDIPGIKHARNVARSLRNLGVEVRVVLATEGKDAADHLAAGHGLDTFLPLADDDEPKQTAGSDAGDGDDGGAVCVSGDATSHGASSDRRSAATVLVDLVLAGGIEPFHDENHRAFAAVPVGGHRETYPVRSRHFRGLLAKLYFEAERAALAGSAMQDAIATLEGHAIHEGLCLPVAIRWAEQEGSIYLDLGRSEWNAVKISSGTWEVIADPPVRFWRPAGLTAMPLPARGGSWNRLWDLLNVREEERVLLQAYIVGAARPRGPYVVLVIQGPQGSAKTTLARVVAKLIDPNAVSIRALPHGERDLLIAAERKVFLVFDNLSGLTDTMADALCRLSTGGGLSTRQLYTDDEEKVFGGMRPIALTSIADLATRPDFLDRSVILNLTEIPEDRRRPEDDFWAEFDAGWPQFLGLVLDGIATALGRVGSVRLARYPRMADFARWSVAAEPAFGVEEGAFTKAYEDNRSHGHALGLEASVLAEPLRAIVDKHDSWEGSATELLAQLNGVADDKVRGLRDWPKGASQLSTALRRITSNLKAVGVAIDIGRTGTKRWIRISTASAVTGVTPVTPRPGGGLPSDGVGDGGATSASPVPSPERSPDRPPGDGDDGGDGDSGGTHGAGETIPAEKREAAEERRAIQEADGIVPPESGGPKP